MEFSYSQTENFEMEKLSSDTGYFKKPVEINRGTGYNGTRTVHIPEKKIKIVPIEKPERNCTTLCFLFVFGGYASIPSGGGVGMV